MAGKRPLSVYEGFSEADEPHPHGEYITVFWPGGPYDFRGQFLRSEQISDTGWKGWLVVTLWVTDLPRCTSQDEVYYPMAQTFFVHPVDGGYALLPKRQD
jgi:hypothetical protein